jgi:putative colanic acid biosynthesis acetyltransferase WcaB
MGLISDLKEDLKVNKSNTKGKFIVFFFRHAHFFTTKKRNPFYFIIGIFFRLFYKFQIQWIMGIDLAEKTKVGKGLCIFHGQGLVVNEDSVLGEYVTLRHNTTIGNKYEGGKSPEFGNNINIGANSVILGDIKIGDGVIIGAGSVVTKDIPAGVVVVGNPARIINKSNKA